MSIQPGAGLVHGPPYGGAGDIPQGQALPQGDPRGGGMAVLKALGRDAAAGQRLVLGGEIPPCDDDMLPGVGDQRAEGNLIIVVDQPDCL